MIIAEVCNIMKFDCWIRAFPPPPHIVTYMFLRNIRVFFNFSTIKVWRKFKKLQTVKATQYIYQFKNPAQIEFVAQKRGHLREKSMFGILIKLINNRTRTTYLYNLKRMPVFDHEVAFLVLVNNLCADNWNS